MAKVQLANVAVLDNPSPFLNPFQFEVTFECIEELKEGAKIDLADVIILARNRSVLNPSEYTQILNVDSYTSASRLISLYTVMSAFKDAGSFANIPRLNL
jgi:hypothetical protein